MQIYCRFEPVSLELQAAAFVDVALVDVDSKKLQISVELQQSSAVDVDSKHNSGELRNSAADVADTDEDSSASVAALVIADERHASSVAAAVVVDERKQHALVAVAAAK